MLKDRFIVLAHPRSGSTHFCCNVLSEHPSLACFDEIFNEKNSSSRKAMEAMGIVPYYLAGKMSDPPYTSEWHFLEALFRTAKEKTGKEIIGFKLFLHQVFEPVLMQLLETYKVILLRRKNLPQAAVSQAIALQTDQWHVPSGKSFPPFDLDFRQLLTFIHHRIEKLNDCERYLQKKKIRYLRLEYESLFTQKTLRSVEAFLSLDVPFAVKEFGNTKLNDKNRYQLINNIDDVRAKFIRLGYPDIYQRVYEDNVI